MQAVSLKFDFFVAVLFKRREASFGLPQRTCERRRCPLARDQRVTAEVHLQRMPQAQRPTPRGDPLLMAPQAVAMLNESVSSAITLPCCVLRLNPNQLISSRLTLGCLCPSPLRAAGPPARLALLAPELEGLNPAQLTARC